MDVDFQLPLSSSALSSFSDTIHSHRRKSSGSTTLWERFRKATACSDLEGTELTQSGRRQLRGGRATGSCILWIGLLGLTIGGFLLAEAEISADQAVDLKRYQRAVQPLLRKYCFDCHAGEYATAGVDLGRYSQAEDFQSARALWGQARDHLRHGIMPPPEMEQPSAAEVAQITDWIQANLFSVDCSGPPQPGRVVFRRLNKGEYDNTIADLLGVDFQPAADFPADDVGEGFDNIAAVLSLPPVLLEKYLAAAEEISQRAILSPELARLQSRTYRGDDFKLTSASRNGGHSVTIYSTGGVEVQHDFSVASRYQIRFRAFGDQAGDELPQMLVQLDGRDLKKFDVQAERDAPDLYTVEVAVPAGRHTLAGRFTNDYYVPRKGRRRSQDRNLHIVDVEIRGPLNPEDLPLPAFHRRLIPQSPNPGQVQQLARQILGKFLRRAWRRPVSQAEVERLVKLAKTAWDKGDSFERGIQLAVQGALVSPHFLFRIEQDPPGAQAGKVYPINQHELATRLSYFLWSSMPDEELFRLADRRRLREPEVLGEQIRRMLADPKAEALVANFASQWLTLRKLETVSPDPKVFPKYTPALKRAMLTEVQEFFRTIMREDRSVLDFLVADWTVLNDSLARHYGIAGVKGSEFRKVSLKSGQRGGVITQAAILTLTSDPKRTSPVKRGKWVLEQLLGTPPPPPPANVAELEDQQGELAGLSLRKRMEVHRENPSCAVCHKLMDPIGLGLENYDAIGAWRQRDGKHTIDPSGELPDGTKFNGPEDLRTILLTRKRQFVRHLAGQLLTFAIGRGLEYTDTCALDEIVEAVEKDDYRFTRLVLEVVRSKPFQLRQATGP